MTIREQAERGIALLDKMAIEELAEAYLAKDAELTALRQRHEKLRQTAQLALRWIRGQRDWLIEEVGVGEQDEADALLVILDATLAADEGEVEPPDGQY